MRVVSRRSCLQYPRIRKGLEETAELLQEDPIWVEPCLWRLGHQQHGVAPKYDNVCEYGRRRVERIRLPKDQYANVSHGRVFFAPSGPRIDEPEAATLPRSVRLYNIMTFPSLYTVHPRCTSE